MITTVKYKAILKAASQHAIPKCLGDLTEWGGAIKKKKLIHQILNVRLTKIFHSLLRNRKSKGACMRELCIRTPETLNLNPTNTFTKTWRDAVP